VSLDSEYLKFKGILEDPSENGFSLKIITSNYEVGSGGILYFTVVIVLNLGLSRFLCQHRHDCAENNHTAMKTSMWMIFVQISIEFSLYLFNVSLTDSKPDLFNYIILICIANFIVYFTLWNLLYHSWKAQSREWIDQLDNAEVKHETGLF